IILSQAGRLPDAVYLWSVWGVICEHRAALTSENPYESRFGKIPYRATGAALNKIRWLHSTAVDSLRCRDAAQEEFCGVFAHVERLGSHGCKARNHQVRLGNVIKSNQ